MKNIWEADDDINEIICMVEDYLCAKTDITPSGRDRSAMIYNQMKNKVAELIIECGDDSYMKLNKVRAALASIEG